MKMVKTSESKQSMPPKIRPFLKTITSSKEAFEGVATIKEEIVEETVPEQAQENDQVDHSYFARITCKVCYSTYNARSTFLAHYVAVHLQQVNKKPTIFITYSKLRHKGAFNNYVDQNLTIFDPLPPLSGQAWIFYMQWKFSSGQYIRAVIDHMTCYDLNRPKIKF